MALPLHRDGYDNGRQFRCRSPGLPFECEGEGRGRFRNYDAVGRLYWGWGRLWKSIRGRVAAGPVTSHMLRRDIRTLRGE